MDESKLSIQKDLLKKYAVPIILIILFIVVASILYYDFIYPKPTITSSNAIKNQQNGDKNFSQVVNQQQQQLPELKIVNNLPKVTNDYTINYNYQYDTFYVHLTGSDKDQSKQEAVNWFNEFGIPLNELKIDYY